MATELGPAKVSVVLDVEGAKRAIADLRKEIRQGQVRKSTAAAEIVRKVERQGRDVSGGKAEERPLAETLIRGAAERARRAGVSNPVSRGLQAAGASRIVPEGLAPIAKAAGIAGLVYAGVRLGTEGAVLGTEALRGAGIGGPGISVLESFVRELATRLDGLEAKVVAAFRAGGTTAELLTAQARIAGVAPTPARAAAQYGSEFEIESEKIRLEKAFDRHKRNDLSRSVGKLLGDAVKGSLSR